MSFLVMEWSYFTYRMGQDTLGSCINMSQDTKLTKTSKNSGENVWHLFFWPGSHNTATYSYVYNASYYIYTMIAQL